MHLIVPVLLSLTCFLAVMPPAVCAETALHAYAFNNETSADVEFVTPEGETGEGKATFSGWNGTSGSYSDTATPGGTSGWTWVKEGSDVKVYNNTGQHMFTFVGFAGTGSSGPITDGSGPGTWGGNWSR